MYVCQATEDPETATTNEEEAEPAEAQELYCLCRQPDDPTRDFIECTDCAQWFHPECVGTSVEVNPSGLLLAGSVCLQCVNMCSSSVQRVSAPLLK